MAIDIFWLHGILMILGYGFLSSLSALYAIYYKYRTPKWQDTHAMLQFSALICSVSGALALFFYGGFESHFTSFHSQLGIAVIILISIVQPILGLPQETATPQQKRRSFQWHGSLGRVALLSSHINIMIGLSMMDSNIIFYAMLLWFVAVSALISFKSISKEITSAKRSQQ